MNGALTPLIWAAAIVLVMTAFTIMLNGLWFDHDTDNAALWLAELVRNIILVAVGGGAYGAYTKKKNGHSEG